MASVLTKPEVDHRCKQYISDCTELSKPIMPQCCVPCCSNRLGHKFPVRNKSLFKQWVVAINREEFDNPGTLWKPSKAAIVCRDHFDQNDYKTFNYYGDIPGKRQLKKDAVPHIFNYSSQKTKQDLRNELRKEKDEKWRLANIRNQNRKRNQKQVTSESSDIKKSHGSSKKPTIKAKDKNPKVQTIKIKVTDETKTYKCGLCGMNFEIDIREGDKTYKKHVCGIGKPTKLVSILKTDFQKPTPNDELVLVNSTRPPAQSGMGGRIEMGESLHVSNPKDKSFYGNTTQPPRKSVQNGLCKGIEMGESLLESTLKDNLFLANTGRPCRKSAQTGLGEGIEMGESLFDFEYQCEICGSSFKGNACFIKHVISHAKREPHDVIMRDDERVEKNVINVQNQTGVDEYNEGFKIGTLMKIENDIANDDDTQIYVKQENYITNDYETFPHTFVKQENYMENGAETEMIMKQEGDIYTYYDSGTNTFVKQENDIFINIEPTQTFDKQEYDITNGAEANAFIKQENYIFTSGVLQTESVEKEEKYMIADSVENQILVVKEHDLTET